MGDLQKLAKQRFGAMRKRNDISSLFQGIHSVASMILQQKMEKEKEEKARQQRQEEIAQQRDFQTGERRAGELHDINMLNRRTAIEDKRIADVQDQGDLDRTLNEEQSRMLSQRLDEYASLTEDLSVADNPADKRRVAMQMHVLESRIKRLGGDVTPVSELLKTEQLLTPQPQSLNKDDMRMLGIQELVGIVKNEAKFARMSGKEAEAQKLERMIPFIYSGDQTILDNVWDVMQGEEGARRQGQGQGQGAGGAGDLSVSDIKGLTAEGEGLFSDVVDRIQNRKGVPKDAIRLYESGRLDDLEDLPTVNYPPPEYLVTKKGVDISVMAENMIQTGTVGKDPVGVAKAYSAAEKAWEELHPEPVKSGAEAIFGTPDIEEESKGVATGKTVGQVYSEFKASAEFRGLTLEQVMSLYTADEFDALVGESGMYDQLMIMLSRKKQAVTSQRLRGSGIQNRVE